MDLYVDYERVSKTNFYRKDRNTKEFPYVNGLYLYALTPGSEAEISELMLCTERCPGDEKVQFSFATFPRAMCAIWLAILIGLFLIL